jgi:hypothetical protein
MGNTITWASTPEAKAKAAAGYKPPKNKWPCPDMQRAQKQAEAAVKKSPETKAAVGGEETENEENRK